MSQSALAYWKWRNRLRAARRLRAGLEFIICHKLDKSSTKSKATFDMTLILVLTRMLNFNQSFLSIIPLFSGLVGPLVTNDWPVYKRESSAWLSSENNKIPKHIQSTIMFLSFWIGRFWLYIFSFKKASFLAVKKFQKAKDTDRKKVSAGNILSDVTVYIIFVLWHLLCLSHNVDSFGFIGSKILFDWVLSYELVSYTSSISHGEKKAHDPTGLSLSPRTSGIPCEHSYHWATKPYCQRNSSKSCCTTPSIGICKCSLLH